MLERPGSKMKKVYTDLKELEDMRIGSTLYAIRLDRAECWSQLTKMPGDKIDYWFADKWLFADLPTSKELLETSTYLMDYPIVLGVCSYCDQDYGDKC
jgi:hypothetical protein